MAVQFEKGLPGKPVEVSLSKEPTEKGEKKAKEMKQSPSGVTGRDYESIAAMNIRREAERQRLIKEMMENDF